MGLTVVLLALGTFALTNLIKMLAPPSVLPPAKHLGALVISAVLVIPFATGARDALLMTAGVFGLSTLLHALHKALGAWGDERRAETLTKRYPR